MSKSRLLPPLIALAALMLVVSGTLAAVLLSDGEADEVAESPQVVASTATSTPEAAATAPPTETPAAAILVPERLRARFEALPDRLRSQAMQQLEDGLIIPEQLEEIIAAYENRNNGVRVGSVLDTEAGSLRIEVYTTGERVSIAVNNETVIRRAQQDVPLASLQEDELVMVISMDEGVTAFSIDAFGVEAP